jgi:hypothetical protein
MKYLQDLRSKMRGVRVFVARLRASIVDVSKLEDSLTRL